MRVVIWMGVAAVALLSPIAALAEGDGLTADADRIPWARLQSRVVAAPGAPGWRAELAPSERSGLQVGGLGWLNDVYFGAPSTGARAQATGFRATGGVFIGARSPLLGSGATSASNGLSASPRRLFGASAASPSGAVDSGTDAATVPYIGIGYSNLWPKSGWSVSADLGVVSQSPGNMVRFGRVFGGSQSLDDVVRDMRLAPLVQLGVSYSF